MKMLKLKFNNPKDDALGFLELSKRMRVICLPGNIYEIPYSSKKILDELNLSYTIIEIESFDNAIRKIRDTASAKM